MSSLFQRSGDPGVVTSLSGLGWGKVCGGCPNSEDLASSVGGRQEPPLQIHIYSRASHICRSHPWSRRTSSSVSTYLELCIQVWVTNGECLFVSVCLIPSKTELQSWPHVPGHTHVFYYIWAFFFFSPEEHKFHLRLEAGSKPEGSLQL